MPSDIFRQEAVDHRAGGQPDGEVLLMLPNWTRWTYRLLIVLLLAAVAFVMLGSVSQYVEGPALIRAEERVSVTATQSGIVASVRATPGMRVEAGDLLVRFRSAEEDAQLAAIGREFDAALVRALVNPLDQAARQNAAAARTQRDVLTARLAERLVRAPEAGTVGDVRVKPGQSVSPGELIASIARPRGRFSVVALLPGQQRPLLRKGLPLRIEVSGYQYVYQDLVIDRVDDEVVGPYEVRRMLGPEVADSVPVTGPVVVVHAFLPGTTFPSGGETYHYFDGMHAAAKARIRSERIITTLVPGIKLFTERPR
jgi:multidrug efflux pump subunit AcrA (membrane-fusion protein)